MLLQTTADLDVVYEEADGLVALERIGEMALDVLMVDNRLRSISGSELIRRFLRRNIDTNAKLPGFVLTGPFDSGPMALEAIRCGASDMVTEENSAEELLAAIREAGSIDHSVDFAALTKFFASEKVVSGSNVRWLLRLNNLGEDEQKILDAIAAGANQEGLEAHTNLPHTKVRWGLDGLQGRLALATRSQLALALYEAGILGSQPTPAEV
jgi:DNA-binding NarL/FixJ family response regulator